MKSEMLPTPAAPAEAVLRSYRTMAEEWARLAARTSDPQSLFELASTSRELHALADHLKAALTDYVNVSPPRREMSE
jgi:hypothetical protein